jgi:hypothetical protein
MKYNGYCTVWHKKSDNTYSSEVYTCWWQSTEAENISKTGTTDVDKAMVYLPVSADVSKGDYIAKGNIGLDVTDSVVELLKEINPLKIQTVEPKDYGSEHMHHIEVTAR